MVGSEASLSGGEIDRSSEGGEMSAGVSCGTGGGDEDGVISSELMTVDLCRGLPDGELDLVVGKPGQTVMVFGEMPSSRSWTMGAAATDLLILILGGERVGGCGKRPFALEVRRLVFV